MRRVRGKQPDPRLARKAERSRSRSQNREEAVAARRSLTPSSRRASTTSSGRLSRSSRGSVGGALAARQSFVHRHFDNPSAETCWLSCLFQSLWHSVVFHTRFEHLTSYCPQPEEKILLALQHTWARYKEGPAYDSGSEAGEEDGVADGAIAGDTAVADEASAGVKEVGAEATVGVEAEARVAEVGEVAAEASAAVEEGEVAAADLVNGFGTGWGDISDAFALIQEELSQSPNPRARDLAELLVLVPVAETPSPESAWQLAKEWQISTPLVAVDISIPSPTRESVGRLAELWVPRAPSADGHRLVAMVCFMWQVHHYVAFCTRQRKPSRCLFFNDIPMLTVGAPDELRWESFPKMCFRFALCPRLALYERASE